LIGQNQYLIQYLGSVFAVSVIWALLENSAKDKANNNVIFFMVFLIKNTQHALCCV
jgi:hypothetical protein